MPSFFKDELNADIIQFTPRIGPVLGRSNSPSNGGMWYDSGLNNFVGVVNGTTQIVGGASPSVGSQVSFGATVSPYAYGAKGDVRVVLDCTWGNATNTGTCASGTFTTSDLGKIAFGTTGPTALTNGCTGTGCGQLLIPQGFLCPGTTGTTFTIGTSYPGCAPVSSTSSCTAGVPIYCAIVYGTQDDTTAIQNASAAAWGSLNCAALELGAGKFFISGNPFSATVPAGSTCAGLFYADASQVGPIIYGQGPANTVLVPLPSFNFANCTVGVSGKACIAGPPNTSMHDFGVMGYGQSGNGTTHNVNLIEFYGFSPSCTSAGAWNMGFSQWQTASTSSTGFVMQYGCAVLSASNIVSEGFGAVGCYANGPGGAGTLSITNFTGVDCFGNSLGSLLVGTNLNSTGGTYWGQNPCNSCFAVEITGSGNPIFNSYGDIISASANGNNNFGIVWAGSGTVNLSGSYVSGANSSGGGNSPLLACIGATCNLNAYSANLLASGTKEQLFFNSGTFNFKDACSNNFSQGGVASSTINVFGSCSITGTTITAGKLVLSAGWGTTAAWSALSGSTQQVFGTITASGTGQAANPTITYTFPTPFLQTPTGCFALQLGGTQAAVANPFTPSSLSATGVTLTYNGTPGAGNTLQVQIQCWNP